MKCPKCEEEVDLSIKMYFKSLLGRYECSHCKTMFKLKRDIKYFLWIIVSIFIVASGSLYIMSFNLDSSTLNIVFAIWLISLFFVYCQIDRKIENTMPTVQL